jgi:hypothetical protein
MFPDLVCNNVINEYKMNVFMTLFVAALFFLLTPGVLLSLPKGGCLYTKAFVHGLVFAVVYHFTHKAVWHYLNRM